MLFIDRILNRALSLISITNYSHLLTNYCADIGISTGCLYLIMVMNRFAIFSPRVSHSKIGRYYIVCSISSNPNVDLE